MNNSAPVSQRIHISFFGCVNSGKSSLVNAFLGEDFALVSDVSGTTTDPTKKTMELLPLGPIVVYDTAGINDKTELGNLRINKTKEILNKTDFAILVLDITKGYQKEDIELVEIFKAKKIPYIVALNKSDLIKEDKIANENEIIVSAKLKENINLLKEKIINKIGKEEEKYIISDKLNNNDTVILVMPIDSSAPKGRIILPQQLTLRELLDKHCQIICVQDTELNSTLSNLKTKPKLIITDSQVFNKIKNIIPNDILLTSFSILFARYKGELKTLINGIKAINDLKDNDNILISEGCTHHRQCNDIGTKKLPTWLMNYTNKKFNFDFTQGEDFPKDLKKYSLIIHCGACMLNETEMKNRIKRAHEQNIPIVNYGLIIAQFNDILKRSLEIFPEILEILEK